MKELDYALLDAHKKLENGEGLSFYNFFKEGADWQINHIWHKSNKNPSSNKEILIEWTRDSLKNKKYDIAIFDKDKNLYFVPILTDYLTNQEVKQWAYIKDLLPK